MPTAKTTKSLKWVIGIATPLLIAAGSWAGRQILKVPALERQVEEDKKVIDKVLILIEKTERIEKLTEDNAARIGEINVRSARMETDVAWMKQKLNR